MLQFNNTPSNQFHTETPEVDSNTNLSESDSSETNHNSLHSGSDSAHSSEQSDLFVSKTSKSLNFRKNIINSYYPHLKKYFYLYFVYCLCYSRLFCSDYLLHIPNDLLFKILSMNIEEPKTTSISQDEYNALIGKNENNTEKEKKIEIRVCGLNTLAYLKSLKIISKQFTTIADHFITLLPPFICCANYIIPRVPIEPKEPIATIQLNAPNEYDIFLKLYFTTKTFSEDNPDPRDYLHLYWNFDIQFNNCSTVKKLLDKLPNTPYTLTSYSMMNGFGGRQRSLKSIERLVSDLKLTMDSTKHYSYFKKNCKRLLFMTSNFFTCYKHIETRGFYSQSYCSEWNFSNTLFITTPHLHIPIPDPFTIISLVFLKQWTHCLDFDSIKPLLQRDRDLLKRYTKKLNENSTLSLAIIKKLLYRVDLLNYFLNYYLNDTSPEPSHSDINTLFNSLEKQKEKFLKLLDKKIKPFMKNQIDKWLWKQTYKSAQYLLKINKKAINIDNLFISIRIIMHLHHSREQILSPQFLAIILYFQDQIYNLLYYDNYESNYKKSPLSIAILEDKRYIFRLGCFFNYDFLNKKEYTIYRREEHQLRRVGLLPQQCKKTFELLILKLHQKKVQEKIVDSTSIIKKNEPHQKNQTFTFLKNKKVILSCIVISCITLFFLLPCIIDNIKADCDYRYIIDAFKTDFDYRLTFWQEILHTVRNYHKYYDTAS